ncbi:heavy metal translocating P-type ATPase [Brevibacterium sp. p3-SID960]|uniref:heavy metal translocating P-type ATPase n=1 Tax=Brevibacterium sp. p3-SID960 TaxID=2916063 RepID=UPI0021A4F6A9|nr:heavy metal translocating P-type ATPase [Brevibacterium sp. p3-SID960]MCT1689708.1 heavy metal translocating P-type ATPase [Brevibacterium sp. p3-SID960]
MPLIRALRRYPLAGLAVVALATTLILLASGLPGAAQILATAVIGIVVLLTAWDMIKDIMAGKWGLDILAVVAMVATVLVGEYLAGLIIVLMLTGGEALEEMAAGRAGRELDALISRAPQFANREGADGQLTQIPVDEVAIGDILVVRPNETLPVDGTLLDASATIDTSAMTGEPLPVTFTTGDTLASGTVNETRAFRMQATAASADSQYGSIVRLVREAVESQAPMVRLADRYAVPFTIVSLAIAAFAWFISGNPTRFAEVLVVATPCPLLIAAPVAFMGGMSRAAQIGVIVKNGGALETLARVRSAALDKTGTLTRGNPEVRRVIPGTHSEDELIALAAAAEQFSLHAFAQSIGQVAAERRLALPEVTGADETATNGVRAHLADGTEVRVGKITYIEEVTGPLDPVELAPGETFVYVSHGSDLAGIIILADELRATAAGTVARLHELGVTDIAMLTGDNAATARAIAGEVGIDEIEAGCTPQTKVEHLASMRNRPVLMVGDGVNDAPVLAAADVGIALGARGASAASESASAVITQDDIANVAYVIEISQRTVRIALQSIWLGIAISIGLMIVAALGYLPAVVGAILQEGVDLVAILGALRALRVSHTPVPEAVETAAGRQAA